MVTAPGTEETLVVPGPRLAAAVQRALARTRSLSAHNPWRVQECLPLGSWLEQVSRAPRLRGDWPGAADFLLTPAQTRVLWTDLIAATSELPRLQVERLAHLAGEAHGILVEWQLEEALAANVSLAAEPLALQHWLGQFQRRCEQLGAGDGNALLKAAVQARVRWPERQFLGFGRVGPALRALGVPAFGQASPHHLPGLRQYLQREDEFSAACDWALGQRASGVEGGIALVMPTATSIDDFAAAATRFQLASDQGTPSTLLPWAGARGRALADFPIVTHALLLLGLESGVTQAEAMTLVQSPYLAGHADERGARARLAARLLGLREERYFGGRLEALARESCPLLARNLGAMLALNARAPRQQTLQDWMSDALERLRAIGWPGGQSLNLLEREARDELARAFDLTAELDAVLGVTNASGALSRLRQTTQERRLPVPVAADAIEVLTLEEALALRPQTVWVLGLNDGAFPQVRTPHPLLPHRLLREAGVPGSAPTADFEFERACLWQLCANARVSVLSCAALDGDTKLRVAPGLSLEAAQTRIAVSLPERWRGSDEVALESRPEDLRLPLPAARAGSLRGGARVLTEQAACPFRAFVSHRLQVSPLELKSPGPDARERGNLIHAVLAAFWTEQKTSAALTGLDETQLDADIARAVDAALATDPQLLGRLRELERTRLTALTRAWLAQEALRPAFAVSEVETEHGLEIGGLQFRLRVDRIDTLEDGSLVIIDYKSGSAGRREWEVPRPEAPQLLLYALAAAPQPVAGIAFGRVNRLKPEWVDLPNGLLKGSAKTDLGERPGAWRAELERLATDFTEGTATVDPKRGETTCRYCDYLVLCRRYEQPDAGIEEETDDDA